MQDKHTSLFTALFCLGLICIAPAMAQETRPVTTQELVARAQKIIIGEVIAQHSAWDELGREIYTYSTLRVQRTIKSEHVDTVLVIRQLGGKVGAIESHVPGAPRFFTGERILVLLGPYAGTPYFDVIDWQAGKYVIKSRAGRQEEVLAGQGPGNGQRVEDFIATLRRNL